MLAARAAASALACWVAAAMEDCASARARWVACVSSATAASACALAARAVSRLPLMVARRSCTTLPTIGSDQRENSA